MIDRSEGRPGTLRTVEWVRVAGAFRRLLVPATLWILLDVALLEMLLRLGAPLSGSHLASFGIASVCLAKPLQDRCFERVEVSPGHPGRRAARFAFVWVCLLAALLRAGPLVALIERLSLPPWVALLPCSLLSVTVACLGGMLVTYYHCADSATREQRWQLLAGGLVVYLFVLRLVYLPVLGLLPDEAYHWQYAQHPDLSYLDHPPMVAIAIGLGTWLFGHNELAMRLPALCAWLVGAGYLAALARQTYGDLSAVGVVLLYSVLPVYFATGTLMTTDILCVAAWSALLYHSHGALIRGRPRAWWGVGLAMGLGLISKYTVALLGPAILLFVLLDARARAWLWRPQPYLAALLAFVLVLPVLYWNTQQELSSFSFQSSRRLAIPEDFSLHFLLLHLAILLSPTGLAAVIAALVYGVTGAGSAEEERRWRRFVLIFALVPFSVFFLFSLDHYPRFHWTGPIWLVTLPVVARAMLPITPFESRALERLQRCWLPTCVLLALLYAAGFQGLALGLPGVGYPRAADYYFWREATPVVQALRAEIEAETGRPPVVVGMAKWSIASALTFYDREGQLGSVGARHLFKCSASMYEYWFPPEAVIGRPLLMIGHKRAHLETPYIDDRLEGVSEVRVRGVQRDGKHLRRVMYRVAERYTGPVSSRGIDPPPFDCGTSPP